ncbi:hypothetical protein QOT17_010617 [Balamuthia mandrillaris]
MACRQMSPCLAPPAAPACQGSPRIKLFINCCNSVGNSLKKFRALSSSTPDLLRYLMVCREWNCLRRDPFLLKLFASTTSPSVLMLDAPERRILAKWLPCENSYKVVVMGEGGTGRKSFICRTLYGKFFSLGDELDFDHYGYFGSNTEEVDGKDAHS